jgi:Cu/Ag efflux protein CusF
MKKLFAATVIATVLAASTAFALESLKATEGMVQSVDPAGKTLTLVSGTTLTVAPNVSIESLKPGEDVTVMYQDGKDGQKELTAFWIDGVTEGGSGS